MGDLVDIRFSLNNFFLNFAYCVSCPLLQINYTQKTSEVERERERSFERKVVTPPVELQRLAVIMLCLMKTPPVVLFL